MNTSKRPLRAVGYVRVSTQDQAVNGISLDAQRAALQAEANRRGWPLEVMAGEAASGLDDDRTVLQNALSALDRGEYEALMVTRLDRLTRSVQGLRKVLERAEAHGWELVIISPGIDTTDPTGRFATSILACAAQYERDLISIRTKEALAHRKATGARMGRPRAVPQELVDRIMGERQAKKSLRAIADALNAEGVPTAQGGSKWHASTVSAIVKTYGQQEETTTPGESQDSVILS